MKGYIDQDYARFRDIVRGRVRKDLRKFIAKGELFGRDGKYIVSIPVKQIRIPTFRYGDNKNGVGQGEGDIGTPIAEGDEGRGSGSAGSLPGQHILEIELSIEEMTKILEEELGLPRIKPKGHETILAPRYQYTSIARVGPESLRHFKRTFKQALRRSIIVGNYDPENPNLIPIPDDRRYRFWKLKDVPQNSAVIIYMMDVSGSMGDEQKEIVRTEAFWIETWLKSNYKKIEIRYIVHDAVAWEVDRDTFYKIRESGGTKISSALELCSKMMKKEYSPSIWNIYPFHFSDGDNWGQDDTKRCVNILKNEVLPNANVFCYGQVRSAYGSGQFKKDLDEQFTGDERVITSEIKDRYAIYDSIRDFLGKGK